MNETDAARLSRLIWDAKYRLRAERDLDATWQRVAGAIAEAEAPAERARWRSRFQALLSGLGFIPGGRIIAGAGSGHRVTLFNCFVMGSIEDSLQGILRALGEGALTMQQGGGVGFDFSTLRPRGAPARASGATASGPVSFMTIWDSTCRTLLSTTSRRGAMMATLRCDHPDIEAFIDAKRTAGALTHFNLSVLVSDAFMNAVEGDRSWTLRFPREGEGDATRVAREVRARDLWDRMLRAAYASAEPGVLFIDRINAENNLAWRERISATNPCGEIPLPPYGACNLGSLNLTRFVRAPFTARAHLDHGALAESAALATRFLDDVIDVSGFPLPAQRAQALATRRIGLGVTGLADALLMMGLRYGSAQSLREAASLMRTIAQAACAASIDLAVERGPFPAFEAEPYLAAPFIRALPQPMRDRIARHGIRNSHLTAIAPAGTISLLAGGISSGIEPIFAARFRRRVLDANGESQILDIEDPALSLWRTLGHRELPPGYVDAADVTPEEQLDMQHALQRHVDNAISKTVTVPADYPFERFRAIYARAYALGLKGCTVYRPNASRGAVLELATTGIDAPHCCPVERGVS